MFKKTMPAEREYKRVANSVNTLDLYPKSIYFLRTDKDGDIVDSTFKIIQMSLKKPIKDVSLVAAEKEINGKAEKKYYFVKNFGDNLWS